MSLAADARGYALPAIQRRQPFGGGDVVDGVGVEERIERLGRPGYGGELITGGPAVDPPDILLHQRVAKLIAQADAP